MAPLPRSLRRGLVAGAAVLVLGGAAVGIAAAQTPPTPTAHAGQARYQSFIDALAKRLNISSAALQTAITQARTDAGLPAAGAGAASAGFGGPGGRGGFGTDLNATATAIGIPLPQLRKELAGKSLAQVASAHGKTGQDVINALEAATDARIAQAVTAGTLTAEQANTRKTSLHNRIEQFVNQVLPQRGARATPHV